jgi:hypothetical protein
MRFLLMASLEHWNSYHQLLDWPSFIFYVDNSIEDEDLHENYRQVFTDVQAGYGITESSLPTAWKAAEEWLQNYHVGMALDKARAFLVAGDRASAFSELLGLREVTGASRSSPVEIAEGSDLGEMLRRRREQGAPIPLGLEQFDDVLEGGVFPGELAIVAGPTNTGKSMVLCHLAATAYKANRKVLFLTHELSRLVIGERILTGLLEKPKQELDPDTIGADLLAMREREGVTDRGMVIVEDGMRTVSDLCHRLEELHPDLVLLDSADDITSRQTYPNLYLAQGEVYSDILRDICHDMNLPVWTTVQLNREAVEKARVSLRHIGDSFKKAQRATLILGLAQSLEEADYFLGPLMKILCLKDTGHGAKGKWWRFLTKFGRGARGWPAFSYFPERGDL